MPLTTAEKQAKLLALKEVMESKLIAGIPEILELEVTLRGTAEREMSYLTLIPDPLDLSYKTVEKLNQMKLYENYSQRDLRIRIKTLPYNFEFFIQLQKSYSERFTTSLNANCFEPVVRLLNKVIGG